MKDLAPIVFVIDDDASVRRAIKRLIESIGLQVEMFGSTQEFLLRKLPDAPSCLVLDVRLPGISGLDFQGQLIQTGLLIPIIFISGHGDIPMTVRAMKAGAVEFLPKPFRDQDLLDAIQLGLEKDRSRRRLEAEQTILRDRFALLTSREREIVAMVVTGMLNKQIAAKIGITENTVKVHRSRAMDKMQAQSLPELVQMLGKLSPNLRKAS
ncbi:MAG: response regulator transcription factor [Terriglobales bacterium]